MAVERKGPGAGRPLGTVRPVPGAGRPAARPPDRPAARPPSRPSPRPAGRRWSWPSWPSAGRWPRPPAAISGPRALPLIAVPALITLGVTLLRLVGELRGWSPEYFSRLPGGGLSPLGITWLAPLVGFYLGWRLERAGVRSPAAATAIGVPAAALLAGPLFAALAGRLLKTSWTANFVLWAVVSVVVAAVVFSAWPALGRVLLAYAYAARLPVALVMWFAISRNWGTHYDALPPGFPGMPPLRRWVWIGVVPQATIWVAWTMATGTIAGALGHRAASRRPR